MNPMMQGPQERATESDPHRDDGRQPSGPAGAGTAGGSNASEKTHRKGVTVRRVVLGVCVVAVLVAAWLCLLVMSLTSVEIAIAKVWANGLVMLMAVALSLVFVVQGLLSIPIAGSIPLYLGGTALYLVFASALGIFLGTIARSMAQFAPVSLTPLCQFLAGHHLSRCRLQHRVARVCPRGRPGPGLLPLQPRPVPALDRYEPMTACRARQATSPPSHFMIVMGVLIGLLSALVVLVQVRSYAARHLQIASPATADRSRDICLLLSYLALLSLWAPRG
jgi:hypothetical protein